MKHLLCILLLPVFTSVMGAELPPSHPPVDHKAMMKMIGQEGSDSDLNLQGKAASVIPVSGYVYVEIAPEEGESFWIAVPENIDVKVGDTVRYKTGPVMMNFRSESLKRTFPSVMFLSRVIVVRDGK